MSALGDALEAEASKGHAYKRCSVGHILTRLSATDRNALITALSGKELSAGSISRALAAADQEVSGDIVVRHRRRACKCTEDDWRVTE